MHVYVMCQYIEFTQTKQCLLHTKNTLVNLILHPQLTLRVKALKRQVDEGETELERMDALRRKAQRDMEEQVELKEALQTRVTALEAELK